MTLHDTSSAHSHSSLPSNSQKNPAPVLPLACTRSPIPMPECPSDHAVRAEVPVCTPVPVLGDETEGEEEGKEEAFG